MDAAAKTDGNETGSGLSSVPPAPQPTPDVSPQHAKRAGSTRRSRRSWTAGGQGGSAYAEGGQGGQGLGRRTRRPRRYRWHRWPGEAPVAVAERRHGRLSSGGSNPYQGVNGSPSGPDRRLTPSVIDGRGRVAVILEGTRHPGPGPQAGSLHCFSETDNPMEVSMSDNESNTGRSRVPAASFSRLSATRVVLGPDKAQLIRHGHRRVPPFRRSRKPCRS